MQPTCLLTILDGWGHSNQQEHNAIFTARTPTWDNLIAHSPHTLLHTSGTHVGLPDEQMGNSEVGHMTIGAGRRILQTLVAIDEDIASGQFACSQQMRTLLDNCLKTQDALHVIGLISDGGVHSHIRHIETLCVLAASQGIQVYVHAITDGRDTPPQSAMTYIESLEKTLAPYAQCAQIATLTGRYYAMDRDNNWDRVHKALAAIMHGNASHTTTSAAQALTDGYQRGETDEFIQPTCIAGTVPMNAHSQCVHMNFRADRARQLVQSILDDENSPTVTNLTEYNPDFGVQVLYPPHIIKNHLGAWLSQHNKTQLRTAETEKYAHVTFFFNGGVELPYEKEERLLIPSPSVATYDLQPEMSAVQLTDALIDAIGCYDCIICNFANGDMVGHTGNFDAAVLAAQTVDACLQRILAKVYAVKGNCFITADHGNAELMWDDLTKQAHTAHTTNPVPFVHYGNNATGLRDTQNASLVDIAPTILDCMGMPIPPEMTGVSLLEDS